MSSKRLRISRTESLVYGELAANPQRRLTERLYDLWRSFFVGLDLDAFARAHFAPNTIVVTSWGPMGDLAGFGYINRTELDVRGRRVLVLGGGAFNHLEYHSSAALNLALFWQAARARMSRPTLPTIGISIASNPIIYDTVCNAIAVSAPKAGFEPPPDAVEIAQTIAVRRGAVLDPHDPWVVTTYACPAQPDRIRQSRRYAHRTQAMREFEARVPDWDRGKALLSWVPLSAANIALSMKRLASIDRRQGHSTAAT